MKPIERQQLGLIGFGAFGKLIYPFLARDFSVVVYDQVPPNSADIRVVSIMEAAASDIVIIATPVQCIAEVATQMSSHLRPGALVLDVGSVKVVPARILSETLPDTVDLICTHPLFGPQSAKSGLQGLKVALCPVRGGRLSVVKRWLQALGLDVHVVSADEHDREMAIAQGITHLVSNVLSSLDPLPKDLTTPSFDLLVQATEMVKHDAASVFHAIEAENPYAKGVRRRFFELAAGLEAKLENLPQVEHQKC